MDLLQFFPGRTFSNYIQKGKRDPKEEAGMLIDELNRTFVREIVDRVNNSPRLNKSMETRHNAFVRLSQEYELIPPLSKDQIRNIFGIRLVKRRRLDRSGILLCGIRYNCHELQKLVTTKGPQHVLIIVDDQEAYAISVQLKPGVWVTAVNKSNIPSGVSLVDVIAANKYFRERNAGAAARTRPFIWDAVRDSWATGAAAATRAKLGTKPLTASAIEKLEKQLFREAGLAVELQPVPAGFDFGELIAPTDVITQALSGVFDYLDAVDDQHEANDEDDDEIGDVVHHSFDEEDDQFGSADNIERRD
jgi:putative transposase